MKKNPYYVRAKASHIYVIAIGGDDYIESCKVGISCNPRQRKSNLQIATPAQLRIYFQANVGARNAFLLEQRALKILNYWKTQGEWLRCTPHLAHVTIQALIDDDKSIFDFIEAMKHYSDVRFYNDNEGELNSYREAADRVCSFQQFNPQKVWRDWGLRIRRAA